MIDSFKHKGLKRFFEDGIKKDLDPHHAPRLKRLLDQLNAAKEIHDMRFPGSGLHLLEPKQNGVWSVSVSGNWRLTFTFNQGKASDLDYLDYH